MRGRSVSRWLQPALLGVALAVMSLPAAAQDLRLQEPLEPPTRSYAHWVLMMDGISAGTLGLAAVAGAWCAAESFNDGAVGTELPCALALIGAIGGGVGFAIAPMFVHGSHGHWDHAAWSVALRLGLPLTALLTLAFGRELAPAVPIAFVVAMVIDWVFLSRTQARPPPDQRVSVVATGAGLGLRVSF